MKLKKMHWIGIIAGAIILVGDALFFLNESRLFFFLLGIALGATGLPFIIGMTLENRKEEKKNEMFLEFSRNLAESVSTGTPISRAIINMKIKDYGVLDKHVKKLANQIELGVPVERALQTFAKDIDSAVVKRAVALINQAERSGGEIENILDSTAHSISEIEKLKNERKSAIYNLVVQGYIIFFIFIGIILVMEFKIIPLTEGISDFGGFSSTSVSDFANAEPSEGGEFSSEDFTMPLLYLLISQGIFMGLVIGKLAEGSVRKGIKHSLILTIAAFLISGAARVFLGT